MSMRWLRDSRLRSATLTSASLFAAGFGALNLFWQLGDWRRDVPGLWDYRSATIGDGVLLPLAAGVLVAAAGRLPAVPREAAVVTSAGILGTAAGALSQFSWLRDPDPQLNWTIPAPHTFNAAGLYHAAFLTVTSGLFAGWTMRLLWRVRHHRRANPARTDAMLRSPIAALLIGCLVGFVGLVILDNYPSRNTTASIVSLLWSLLGAVLAGSAATWSFGSSAVRSSWRTIAWGSALAMAICLVAWRSVEIIPSDLVVLAAMVVAIGTHLWKMGDSYWWIGSAVACSVLAGGLNLSIDFASINLILPLSVGVVTLYLVRAIVRILSPMEAEANQLWVGIISPVLLLIFAARLREGSYVPASARSIALALLAGTVAITFVSRVAIPLGKARWAILTRDEKLHGPGRKLEITFWLTWTFIICLFIATVVPFFRLIGAAGESFGINPSDAADAPFAQPMIVGAVLAVALALWAVKRSRSDFGGSHPPTWTKDSQEPVLPVTMGTLLRVIAAAGTWALTPWVVTLWVVDPTTAPGHTRYSGALPTAWAPMIFGTWAVILALWFGYVTVETIRTSVARIEFYELGRRGWIAALSCGAGVASTVGWLWAVGVWAGGDWVSVPSIAAVVGIVYFGGTAVVTLCGWALASSAPGSATEPGYLSLHHPAANVFNNLITPGFSLALTVFAGPIIYRAVTKIGFDVPGIKAGLSLISPYFAFSTAFALVGDIIDEHVKGERERGQASKALLARAGNDFQCLDQLNHERVALSS